MRRVNGRCPSAIFLAGMDGKQVKKFKGSFDALTKSGASYHNDQRFKALTGDGKPLWEFKEHDHRVYCFRRVVESTRVDIVLLDGWVKDKAGKTNQEKQRILSAKQLLSEFLAEYQGGVIS